MTTTARPVQRTRPTRPGERRRRGIQWWHYVIVVMVLLTAAGLAWGGYALWFAMTHVRATHARITGLVVNVAAKDDTRVQKVLVRTGDEVREGQAVVLLDKADLEARVQQARANLAAQESALAQAQRDLELAIRQAAASIQEADAQVQAARARLAQAKAEMEMRSREQPDEVRSAAAAVESARTELEDAQANLRRMQRLFEQGAVSQTQLDAARTRSEVARSAVEAAEAALALAKARDYQSHIHEQTVATRAAEQRSAEAGLEVARTQQSAVALKEEEVVAKQAAVEQARAAVKEAETRLSDAVLRSPINGVVVRGPGYSVKDGEVVVKGAPIVTIVCTDVPLWINATVSELEIGRVREGQPVLIRVDAYRRRVLHGKVDKIGKATEFQADSSSSPWMLQQVPIKITFDPEGLNLAHGMTCRVWIDVRKR